MHVLPSATLRMVGAKNPQVSMYPDFSRSRNSRPAKYSIGNVGIKSAGKEEAKGATEIDENVFE